MHYTRTSQVHRMIHSYIRDADPFTTYTRPTDVPDVVYVELFRHDPADQWQLDHVLMHVRTHYPADNVTGGIMPVRLSSATLDMWPDVAELVTKLLIDTNLEAGQ